MAGPPPNALDRFRIVIAAIFVGVWVLTIVWDATHELYEIPVSVTGPIAGIAAWLFAGPVLRRRNGEPDA